MLLNFEGLNNLRSIGTDLRIMWNQQLTNISALNGIEKIPGNLVIDNNNLLKNLEGLKILSGCH